MNQIVNFGSANIDHVYRVEHLVKPGETLSSLSYERFMGGKGLNQSVALSRAGANVFHLGKVGGDGADLVNFLKNEGVNCNLLDLVDGPTGHAIIQVDSAGQNSIIIEGGANRKFTRDELVTKLKTFNPQDFLLVQNETNLVGDAMEIAAERGMRVVFNPSPITADIQKYPLNLVEYLVINETEGQHLSGATDPSQIVKALIDTYPSCKVVLTLGERGVIYHDSNGEITRQAVKTKTVDTTAAGDTFLGFFVGSLIRGIPVGEALDVACRAAAICVSRPGAAPSIPALSEVLV